MKSIAFACFAHLARLASVASALLVVAGCGGEAENMAAQYPTAPVGTDAEQASALDSEVAASESPSVAPVEAPVGEPPAEDQSAAPAYAQPQAGDVQVGADASEYADTDPAALTDFRSTLDPYGTWVDDSTYGTVWVPSATVVGDDFAPYVTAGHWAYDDDYVWVSDYQWGWAPFHYGRWVYIAGRGWSWIPGRTYAGAWVTWRHGYDGWGYVGWAPMPPTWYWYRGVAVGIGFVPPAPYVFCPTGHLFHPGVGGRIVRGGEVPVIASHTRPYVPANPTVGGHAFARPAVGGPPPRALGMNDSQIVHATGQNDRGIAQARQFARPSTAASLGAHPPSVAPSRNIYAGPRLGAGAPIGPGPGSRSIATAPSIGRNAPVVTAPQYRGVTPSPSPPPLPCAVPRAAFVADARAASFLPRVLGPARFAAELRSAARFVARVLGAARHAAELRRAACFAARVLGAADVDPDRRGAPPCGAERRLPSLRPLRLASFNWRGRISWGLDPPWWQALAPPGTRRCAVSLSLSLSLWVHTAGFVSRDTTWPESSCPSLEQT